MPAVFTFAPLPATTLTPPMVPLSTLVEDECAKRGLFCHGGTICVDLTCQCPPNTVLLNDQCQPMMQPGTVLRPSKNRRELNGPGKSSLIGLASQSWTKADV